MTQGVSSFELSPRSVSLLGAAALWWMPAAAWAQADFAVTYASEPPAVLAVGDFVSVSYDVENVGTSAASFTVGFVIDDGTQAYLLYEDPISLSAGGYTSGTMSFSVPSGAEGVWYAGLVADPYDMFVEPDEDNNVWVFTNQLTIGGGTTGGSITVTSEPLPAAQVGASYTATLHQVGGTAPSWYVSSGTLPPGLTLSSGGQISGAPTSAGAYSFTVNAEQSGFTGGSGTFVINVSQGASTISVTPAELPEAKVGMPYHAVLQASGGTPPYGYQVIGGPSWLITTGAGTEAGTLSGTPDATGHFALTVYVVDSAGGDATVMTSLDVVEAGPLTVVGMIPAAVTSKPYQADVVTGGAQPYTLEVTGGSVPSGLTLDGATGHLSGVPAEAGSFSFEVSVVDTAGASASGRVDVTVGDFQGLSISSKMITVFVNADVDAPLVAVGGVAPYSWQLLGGALPDGLAFDAAAGKLTGKTGKVAMTSATFVVTDAEGSMAEQEVQISVRVYRAPSTGGGSRRGGCTCAGLPARGSSLLLLPLLGWLLLRSRPRTGWGSLRC